MPTDSGVGGRLRRRLYWLVLILYMVMIFEISAQPKLPNLARYGVRDWMQHGIEYMGLGALAAKTGAVTWPMWTPTAVLGFGAAVGAAYGVTDELHQRSVPGRCCDLRDWSADLAGSVVGSGVLILFVRRRRKNAEKTQG